MSKMLPMTKGYFAMVDDSDFEFLSAFRWYANVKRGRAYAEGLVDGKKISLHRLLMGSPPGMFVDHINNDPLDNRRSNLRICTHKQNQWNQKKRANGKTSKYRGVYWRAAGVRHWLAQICINDKSTHIGSFHTEEEAARAFDAAARQIHGEFASLNFKDAVAA